MIVKLPTSNILHLSPTIAYSFKCGLVITAAIFNRSVLFLQLLAHGWHVAGTVANLITCLTLNKDGVRQVFWHKIFKATELESCSTKQSLNWYLAWSWLMAIILGFIALRNLSFPFSSLIFFCLCEWIFVYLPACDEGLVVFSRLIWIIVWLCRKCVFNCMPTFSNLHCSYTSRFHRKKFWKDCFLFTPQHQSMLLRRSRKE